MARRVQWQYQAVTQRPERVALVTGSSRGLLRRDRVTAACDGFAVAVNSLHGDEQAGEVVRAIRDDGGTADALPGYVTDRAQVDELVAWPARPAGVIDTLVLNATGAQPEALVDDVGWREHLAQLVYFVGSPVLLGRRCCWTGTKGDGWIVHIDSEVAGPSPIGRSAYATAKNAQIGLARSWPYAPRSQGSP